MERFDVWYKIGGVWHLRPGVQAMDESTAARLTAEKVGLELADVIVYGRHARLSYRVTRGGYNVAPQMRED